MSKPRAFLSSTCYDLSPVRGELQTFLESSGFEVLNSESLTFGVTPQKHSHSACIDQVKNANYLILLIGGRHGGTFIGSENSITNEEYKAAVKLGIPIIIFVQKAVQTALLLYKKNPSANFDGIVDDKRVFHFIEYIQSSVTDNWMRPFESIEDIKTGLRAQLAYYLLLFSEGLRKSVSQEKASDSSKLPYVPFPSNIEGLSTLKLDQDAETVLRKGLRVLHAILVKILTSDTKNDGKAEKLKCLWVLGRWGQLDDGVLRLDNDTFKDRAWSTGRGRRVFTQLESFGVVAHYDEDVSFDEAPRILVTLSFEEESEDALVAYALQIYVQQLIKVHGENAMDLFVKADMRLFIEQVGKTNAA